MKTLNVGHIVILLTKLFCEESSNYFNDKWSAENYSAHYVSSIGYLTNRSSYQIMCKIFGTFNQSGLLEGAETGKMGNCGPQNH